MSDLTLDRLKAWLADEGNYARPKVFLEFKFPYNDMPYNLVRKRFVTRNGYEISIQQSAGHYCSGENEAEVWACPPSPLLIPYGDGEDPYAYVPLEVVAGYIDALESLPPPENQS